VTLARAGEFRIKESKNQTILKERRFSLLSLLSLLPLPFFFAPFTAVLGLFFELLQVVVWVKEWL
jgi:hypothetical protein